MVTESYVDGYEKLKQFIENFKDNKKNLYILFTGKKDEAGVSWCSDCNDAAPVIKQAVEKFAPQNATIVYCDAGDRPYWKDPQNPFRHDGTLGKIQVIPTFIRYGQPQRLDGSDQCGKLELLEMFFETDDD
ncbi:thioredoxin domain-containing protein 17-like [Culicoides brevitarsis]|uniref:thioredoxin domain-containing protein 17-like n=1 Tax=Culicoides brevitarsis TaxID=469753 RepID=UPI00307C2C8C